MKQFLYLYLILIVTSCSNDQSVQIANLPLEVYSDLETANSEDFYTGDYTFGKSHTQTDKAARSGDFSAMVNMEKQYALDFQFHNVEKGNFVVVSVWRKSTNNIGALALADNNNQVIKIVGRPIRKEKEWELLQFSYLADKDYPFLKTYVYNPQDEEVFFDDITIKHFAKKPMPTLNASSLKINIGDGGYTTLDQFRLEALQKGVIGQEQKEYIKGTILFNNDTISVKLRLKGDWTDHLEGNKWSLRIKVQGNNSIFGFKSFSIQSPHTRAFLREWTMHKIYEQEDVLTPRYLFTSVSLNGENLGIYAIEEHFDKQLVESKQRREGPIVKFNEEGFWERNSLGKSEGKWINSAFYEAAEVIPFKKKRTFKNPILKSNFKEAERLMLRYKEFDKELEEVFNIEALAKYYALADLGNISHGLRWHNMRLYYNPVTCNLEQIAFDCFTENLVEETRVAILGLDTTKLISSAEDYFTYQVFNHAEFKEYYLQYLERYSDPDFMEKIYLSLASELDTLEKWMQIEFPNYIENRDFFHNNAAGIKKQLEKYRSSHITYSVSPTILSDLSDSKVYFPSIGLKATKQKALDSTNIDISLLNYHNENISIVGYGACQMDSCFISLINPISIEGYNQSNPSVKTTLPSHSKYLFFKVENLGDSMLTRKISKWNTKSDNSKDQVLTKESKLTLPAGIILDEENQVISFNKGKHTLTENLIIPKGYTLRILAGTRINLKKGAAIISYGPLLAEGSEENKIIISSSDFTGQGLVVLNQNERSIVNYVTFKNLRSISQGSWKLTGAVTFYQSELAMNNCNFLNNNSEDALNIIRSTFEIDNILIKNASSDGFDADFCRGNLINSTFINATNDGIDFSGSEINIRNCLIQTAGDKGISGGENSTLTVDNCIIEKVNIAIAAKDKTTINVSNTKLNSSNYGYAAFQKKAEYGVAKINIQNSEEQHIENMFLIDKGSEINFNGKTNRSDKKISIDSLYLAF